MDEKEKGSKRGEKMKKCDFKRTAAALFCAATIAVFLPGENACASAPEFSRSEQEWASLRDNSLEYAEMEGLVEEYNPTVQKNRFSYRKFISDYGRTKDDVAGEYRRLAQELLEDINYPDEDDPSYALRMSAALSSEMQANALLKQADENLEDAEIIRLNYEMAEKALVRTAQNHMIAWHTERNESRMAELEKQLSERTLAVIQTKEQVGTATRAEVFDAMKEVKEAERMKIRAQSSADTTKRKLQIMLGWKADGNPEMGAIPDLDMNRISGMDPDSDVSKALETNYTLRINKKKLANAVNGTDVRGLELAIKDNEARVKASLDNAYQAILGAKEAYIYRIANASLKRQIAKESQQRYALGTESLVQKESDEIEEEKAVLEEKNAAYALFQAMEAYDWEVNGLASAGN